MKKLLLALLIPTLLLSCSSGNQANLQDPRPDTQVKFIKQIILLGDKARSGLNEIRKDELIDSAEKEISRYTIDSLNKKFTDWDAEIIKINNEPYGLDLVSVEFMVKKNIHDTEQYPEFDSIILKANIAKDEISIINKVKTKRINEKVKVSGIFEYTKGKLNHDSYTITLDDKINNPSIRIKLTSIN